MFLFKPKLSPEEIPPPPPPFPGFEVEEEKPKLFSRIVESKKTETSPNVKEFDDLISDVDKQLKPVISKKVPIGERQKITKKALKKLKTEKAAKKLEKAVKLPELEEGLELEDIDFELPKELKPSKKEIELPETLEGFDIEDSGKQLEQKTKKPKEILEAEEEIKSAIEKIKKQERTSFLKKLFAKKEKIEEKPEEHLIPESGEVDEISVIQSNIKNAREALMKFDLGTAKKNYIEIMKIYNKIKPQQQAKVYYDIRDLYFERKSAEELKV